MKIYVNFEIPETLYEFLKLFFSVGDYNKQGVETYENKECTRVQCPAGKNRSILDIYSCITTYYSEVTLKDFIEALLSIDIKSTFSGQKLKPYLMRCNTINRHVMLFHNSLANPFEYEKFSNQYSWQQLLELIDVHNFEQLQTYIKTHRKNE